MPILFLSYFWNMNERTHNDFIIRRQKKKQIEKKTELSNYIFSRVYFVVVINKQRSKKIVSRIRSMENNKRLLRNYCSVYIITSTLQCYSHGMYTSFNCLNHLDLSHNICNLFAAACKVYRNVLFKETCIVECFIKWNRGMTMVTTEHILYCNIMPCCVLYVNLTLKIQINPKSRIVFHFGNLQYTISSSNIKQQ